LSQRFLSGVLSRHERLKAVYSAWALGQFDLLLSIATPDCEFRFNGNPVLNPLSGTRVGKEAIAELFATFHAAFQLKGMEVHSIIIEGSNAAVHWRARLYHRRTNGSIECECCDVFRFEGEQIKRFTGFYDTATMALFTGRAAAVPEHDIPGLNGTKAISSDQLVSPLT